MKTAPSNHPVGNLPAFIRRMLEPSFYPHPTRPPVRLVQTHISYVLLTGDFAYKVKKPVDLGFVDFSTPELRRHFCHEELRLNRRGAPEVYLDVVEIRQNNGDFSLDSGVTFDFAVRMRQLPEDGMFIRLIEKGLLESDHVNQLARTVADYHAAAPTNPHVADFGRPERIRRVIEDNYEQTRQFIGGSQTREQFDQTRAFTESYFLRSPDLFESRRANGFVRACHGDLHLGNICRWNGRNVLFDCIEFNESFRCIDVIQDAAFTAMDLQAHGRPDLSTQFVNRYAEHTGDWEGLALLPLYLCRHAYVRGKINALLATEPVEEAVRGSALQSAAMYFRLAASYAHPQQGQLIVVMGISGSGKSTLAAELARQIGAFHIRSDAVRKHLAAIPLDRPAPASAYDADSTAHTYQRLLDLGISLALRGSIVILDATYLRCAQRHAVIAASKSVGIPVQIVLCTAPPDVLRQRLSSRTGDVSDARPGLLTAQLENLETFDESERLLLLTVDTTSPAQVADLHAKLGLLRKNP